MTLVVKNGLKMRSFSSAGIPGPSSVTSTITAGVGGYWPANAGSASMVAVAAVIVIAPVPSSASNAFATRLVKTCASWCWSPSMVGSPSSTCVRTTTSRRGTVDSASVTACCSTSVRSVRSTCRRTGRTNSSISTTMALASFASLRMSASSDCASFESGTWRRSSPAITSMPASGFFSSCAMPAAISPSDARRSRSRSRSSNCSTCVRSLKKSTAPIGAPPSSFTCESV